jgi:hypothetical protein
VDQFLLLSPPTLAFPSFAAIYFNCSLARLG